MAPPPCLALRWRGDYEVMKNMRFATYKTAFIALLALTFFMPLHVWADGARLQVVAFGDSLLDAGTYAPFAKVAFHGGRFTTNPGLNFTQDVARHYGDRLTPAFVGGFGQPLEPAGGLDYAQGGSRVSLQPGIGHAPMGYPDYALATTVPVADQVNAYLSAHGGFNSDQLVLINGGANDIFFELTNAATLSDAEAAIMEAAQDLAGIVGTLVANGAMHVVVMNVPDIGIAPFATLSSPPLPPPAVLTGLSQLFNSTLEAALNPPIFGGKAILIDAFTIIDNIIGNFQTYGFSVSNKNIACNLSAQVSIAAGLCMKNPGSLYCINTNPSPFASSLFCSPKTYTTEDADYTFMFADLVHPTTHLNKLFAYFVEQHIALHGLVASE
jgi:phospholipase/lecithinase/hemolysin